MHSKQIVRKSLVLSIAAAVLMFGVVAVAQAAGQAVTTQQAPISVDIAAQPLGAAPDRFAKQTGLHVVYAHGVIMPGARSPAIVGSLPPAEILHRMLASSGLQFAFVNAHTVSIRRAPFVSASATAKAAQSPEKLDVIKVTATIKALSATRSDTPVKEIPQSVSVISQETLNQQNAVDLPSALKQATGIDLVQSSSQETTLYSRGFPITSVHVDGSAPLAISNGSVDITSRDIAEYESVQVLRGSDALSGGMGNPGASIDLQRKEPTSEFQSELTMMGDSWDHYRAVADVSGPLSSAWSGRVVMAGGSQDYFYDTADQRERFLYGVLKYAFSPSTSVSFGGS